MRFRLIFHSSSKASSQTQIAGASGYSSSAGFLGLRQSPCTQTIGFFISLIYTRILHLTHSTARESIPLLIAKVHSSGLIPNPPQSPPFQLQSFIPSAVCLGAICLTPTQKRGS